MKKKKWYEDIFNLENFNEKRFMSGINKAQGKYIPIAYRIYSITSYGGFIFGIPSALFFLCAVLFEGSIPELITFGSLFIIMLIINILCKEYIKNKEVKKNEK